MSLEQTIDRVLSARTEHNDALSSDKTITRWRNDIEKLYAQVENWMKPYVDAGKMTIDRRRHEITEEKLGTYPIDLLDFDVGDETIRLEPRASRVIGAQGRVDMFRLGSTDDPILLVLTGEDESRTWNVVDRSGRTKLNAMTKDAFEGAVERLFSEFSSHASRVPDAERPSW